MDRRQFLGLVSLLGCNEEIMFLPQIGILGFTRGEILVPNQSADRTSFLSYTRVGNDWQGRANLLENELGEWVMIWVEGVDHSDRSDATQRVNISFSNDEGETWTANNLDLNSNPVSGFPLEAQAVGGVVVDNNFFKCPNGDLIILGIEQVPSGSSGWNGLNVTISQFRSTNHGKTWTYDQDFPTQVGLTTAAQKGSVQGCFEHMTIGADVYVPLLIVNTSLSDSRVVLCKTTNNADTWSIVGDIVGLGERPDTWTETGLVHLGGSKIAAVGAPNGVNFNEVEYRESEDLGVTWGTVRSIYAELGYTGICQPTMIVLGGNILLSGRDTKKVVGNDLLSLRDRCSVWTTEVADPFQVANTRRNYLDPYYSGASTSALLQGDAGYGRALQKSDNSVFYVGYYGLSGEALIYKYSVSHVALPSEEMYANNEFLPETIQTAGVRLQMNRDNIVASPSAPVNGGLAIASRLDNYLVSPNLDYWWLATATTSTEFLVDSNSKGWCQFIDGHFSSDVDTGNSFFKASFSISMKLRPADGQPAAVQNLLWNNSTNSATIGSGVYIQLQTGGQISVRYGVGGTLVTATTSSAVFANGPITTEVHLVVTFTSGGMIAIIVDGSSVSITGGDLSTVTMASFASTRQVLIGRRQNVSTFDLPYVGLMREFMIFPNKILDSTEIANLALL